MPVECAVRTLGWFISPRYDIRVDSDGLLAPVSVYNYRMRMEFIRRSD